MERWKKVEERGRRWKSWDWNNGRLENWNDGLDRIANGVMRDLGFETRLPAVTRVYPRLRIGDW